VTVGSCRPVVQVLLCVLFDMAQVAVAAATAQAAICAWPASWLTRSALGEVELVWQWSVHHGLCDMVQGGSCSCRCMPQQVAACLQLKSAFG
jgi:hypothetical protein